MTLMSVSERDLAFLKDNRSAAMITVGKDGVPKAARVGVCLVDGKVWSSGTEDRVRTRRLRADPRCTLFVFDSTYSFLTLETTVNILDGPDAPELNVRLFREMQGKPKGPLSWFGADLEEPEFRQKMVEERRLIYEFEISRAYGLH
jgi:PPOX class probable F420-dependent enzyme